MIHFQPKKRDTVFIKNIKNLEKITQIFFSNRRKMIKKNIKRIISDEKIERINGIQLNLRPTDLNPEIYYKITELYEKN